MSRSYISEYIAIDVQIHENIPLPYRKGLLKEKHSQK